MTPNLFGKNFEFYYKQISLQGPCKHCHYMLTELSTY